MLNFLDDVRKCPKFQLPSETTFKTVLLKNHASEISSIRSKLSECNAISLCFDMWSKFGQSFIDVTAHGIDPTFVRVNCGIGLVEFNESHTGIAIVGKLREAIAPYCSFDKIVAVTHDAAKNNHSRASLNATPSTIRILCTAHKMANAVKRLFKLHVRLRRTYHVVKRLTKLFRKSATARRVLENHQQQVFKKSLKLPAISATRFNGGFLSMNAFLSQEQAITPTLKELEEEHKSTFKLVSNYLGILFQS